MVISAWRFYGIGVGVIIGVCLLGGVISWLLPSWWLVLPVCIVVGMVLGSAVAHRFFGWLESEIDGREDEE